ncbi:MAG TPA: multicopper oxidase domain-containing protein [Rhodanobacteraceae bacterium]|nr:multicopper oxidase domain-containing protein [Rhodanobacteraceae bacterium]
MSHVQVREPFSEAWPAMTRTALRVAFGLIWVANAAFTWTSGFAIHYVGYLHNAAQGQPAWSAWWFDLWIALVTPHADLFVWLTRIVETALALALVLGFARKTVYLLGALFSLLVWSTAEGFGGPYTVGATNMGSGIVYVLVFIALMVINSRSGPSPYSLDFYIEKAWPDWRSVSEWRSDTLPATVHPVSWRVQGPVLFGIAVLVFFLVAGLHSSLHVKPPTPTAAAAAVSPLSLASTTPVQQARDARLPPLQPGESVDVNVDATDASVSIASGVDYQAWTFGKSVPGPVIHVRQGQTVNVTFTNHGTMEHSLDFHSAITPPNLHYAEVKPGESLTYSFVAKVPGAFLYHCGTPPVLLHIGNGMYGAIIVDPATPLPPAAESYVIVQSEWYTQQISGKLMGPDFQKMKDERPDEVVFNGVALQYKDHPLTAAPGKLVRIYFVNAGPDLWSSFHVIGGIFDKVYPGGDAADAISGVSTYSVGPGAGAIFDITLDQPGNYVFVDHDMAHAIIGAQGVLQVGNAAAISAEKPPIASAPASAPSAPPAAGPPTSAPAAAGPYKFDAAHGASLYASTCSACHQATGTGLPGAFPPLKGDPVVLNPDPAEQIETVLNGAHGRTISGTTYPSAMPPFGPSLSDADIADIINHERSSWGNQGKPITADQVQAERAKGPGK